MSSDVVDPSDVAVFRLALVVIVALGAVRQFAATSTVRVPRRRLLTDELGAALGVTLAHLAG